VYLPLTAGHHVDHQIVRAAGERWATSPSGRRLRVAYYEDYPYAESPEEVASALEGHPALRYRADRAKGHKAPTAAAKVGYSVNVVELGEDAIRAKLEAIACYRSQLSTFFADDAEMEARVRSYAGTVGGGRPAERVWKRTKTNLG
jgi:LmbE family N-acetylglucosaminyl deacetylase